MNSNSQTHFSGDITAKKPNGKDVVSSAEPVKRVGQTGVSLATAVSGDSKSQKPNGKAVVSSAEPVKRAGQPGVSLAIAVSGDPKSKKPNGKAVVSSSDEILFFKDVKFGPQGGELRFRLIHFWEARNALTKGTGIQGFIPPNRIETYLPHMVAGSIYRLNNFYESKSKTVYRVAEPDVTIAFSWNFVLSVLENSSVPFPEDRFRFYGYEEFEAACDLRGDLYGLGLLVSDSLVLDEVEIASSRRILVHVQTHDGPVMKLYIWDKAAADFCEKFKALGKPPTVLLVRTVNPKHFGGALSMSSLSSSRVFFDMDVQATREYLAWFESNTDVANRVNAEIVTKAETATIGELFSYMKQEGAKANESVEDDHVVPVPQSLTDTIGQTRTFIIKVSKHNLDGKTQALTGTKVLPLEVPALEGNIEEDVDEEPADERDGAADGTVKRSSDGIESGETKRAKCG
uniref:Replication factor A C-terminal domain-containing protein n=1 Tax=Brassica oleracea var. oleracea TaxID=109376 RepID=A0A0D3DKK1_BRAOL